jgi:predicted GNAT family N-acyltransferase
MMNIKDLNIAQQGELIENFVEIVVDNMSTESLVVYAQEQLKDYYSKLSYRDLEEEINEYDEELLEELIDNETNETLIS